MPTPAHRPPELLPGAAFATFEARAAGLSRRQVSGRAYRSLGYGLWAIGEDPGREALVRATLAATPGAVASHLTAAQLLGLRLPDRLREAKILHITSVRGATAPRRAGVVGHRSTVAAEDIWRREGILATGPLRTVVDLAALRGPADARLTDVELIAAFDGLISTHSTGPRTGVECWCAPGELLSSLDRFGGVHGIARARRAALRAMPAVDSMLETRLRVLLEDSGLTGWETDLELTAPGGARVWPDLADRRHRISVQVEGPHHDELRQRERDIERARTTAAAGWLEVRLTVRDLKPSSWGGMPRAVILVREARRQQNAR